MSEVCDRAARIARTLADRGVGPETLVGLCVGRGTGMLTALLGVWWAGGAYVPLDPGFPQARLAAMARGAGLRIVISDTAHHDLARSVAAGATVICVDDPAATAVSPLAPVTGARRRARLRHLHLRLDRAAQGRRRRAPGGRESARVVPARARARQ